jgi:uncharacterized protein YggU (UPF0235/DUF167 family)
LSTRLSIHPAHPWTATSDGLLLTLRLTPKGGRDAIDGIEQMAGGRPVLKARVRSAPSGGDANASLTRLIARTLGVPLSSVTLVMGASARIKRLKVAGDARTLVAALERVTG